MTQLVLARHGETVWHAENRYAGSTDIQLTATGMRQAALLAEWAASAGLNAVWASPLRRARLTAEPSAAAAGLGLTIDARLREIDFGMAEGLTSAEMAQQFPAALRAFRTDPVTAHLPGGEDPVAATRRFIAALHDISGGQHSSRVLVVAHSTVIRLALCRLLGIPLQEYRRLFPALGPCARTEIVMSGGHVALLQLNVPPDTTETADGLAG